MQPKTVLITGGCGFIGSHVAEACLNRGMRVICFDNLSTGKKENLEPWWDKKKCTLVVDDVVNLTSSLKEYFRGVDVVFHNAASKCTVCAENPIQDLYVNALGTLRVIQTAYECGVKKVIHASTGSVNEINSYYGNSKAAGENYCRVFRNYHPDFTYTVLRYHHVYGPRQDDSDKGGVIPIFIRRIRHQEPTIIYGGGDQTRHFTHVSDVVNANLFCMNNHETDNKTFDLLPFTPTTIIGLSNILHRKMGYATQLEFYPEKPGDIKHFKAHSQPLLDLGYEFSVNLEDGLRDTIGWYVKKWESEHGAKAHSCTA